MPRQDRDLWAVLMFLAALWLVSLGSASPLHTGRTPRSKTCVPCQHVIVNLPSRWIRRAVPASVLQFPRHWWIQHHGRPPEPLRLPCCYRPYSQQAHLAPAVPPSMPQPQDSKCPAHQLYPVTCLWRTKPFWEDSRAQLVQRRAKQQHGDSSLRRGASTVWCILHGLNFYEISHELPALHLSGAALALTVAGPKREGHWRVLRQSEPLDGLVRKGASAATAAFFSRCCFARCCFAKCYFFRRVRRPVFLALFQPDCDPLEVFLHAETRAQRRSVGSFATLGFSCLQPILVARSEELEDHPFCCGLEGPSWLTVTFPRHAGPETTANWRRREALIAWSPVGPRPSARRWGGASDDLAQSILKDRLLPLRLALSQANWMEREERYRPDWAHLHTARALPPPLRRGRVCLCSAPQVCSQLIGLSTTPGTP